jgi:hypothetical protein
VFGVRRDDILEIIGVYRLFKGSVVDGLAGVLIQLRFGVEALDVADAAAQEYPDDGLGLGREVRFAVGPAVGGIGAVGNAVAEEHSAEGEAGEAEAGVGEEGAAGDAGTTAVRRGHGSGSLGTGVAQFLQRFQFEQMESVLVAAGGLLGGDEPVERKDADFQTEHISLYGSG